MRVTYFVERVSGVFACLCGYTCQHFSYFKSKQYLDKPVYEMCPIFDSFVKANMM